MVRETDRVASASVQSIRSAEYVASVRMAFWSAQAAMLGVLSETLELR